MFSLNKIVTLSGFSRFGAKIIIQDPRDEAQSEWEIYFFKRVAEVHEAEGVEGDDKGRICCT